MRHLGSFLQIHQEGRGRSGLLSALVPVLVFRSGNSGRPELNAEQ